MENWKDGKALVYEDRHGNTRCSACCAFLSCDDNGDMPDKCPCCGAPLDYQIYEQPDCLRSPVGFVRGQKGLTMSKKNTAPIITHTELICYAIAHLDARIRDIESKADGLPENHPMHDMCHNLTAPLMNKRNTLCQLYLIETGTEYIG